MWPLLISGLIGAGASLIGANKQASAISDANAQNAKAQEEANRLNYEMWLRSRGTGPNGQAVNYIMPEWATVNTNTPRQLLRKGQAPVATRTAGVAGANNTASGGGGGVSSYSGMPSYSGQPIGAASAVNPMDVYTNVGYNNSPWLPGGMQPQGISTFGGPSGNR